MSDIATSASITGAARNSRGAPVESRDAASPRASDGGGFWWRVAGVAWVGAVLAYVWGRYDLPFSLEAWPLARERISQADWMLILAALLGPLVLLWVLASALRGSRRLSDESRSMAEAARRMADEAARVPAQAAADEDSWRASGLMGEVQGASPAHIRREVERATHAIGALHQQMRAIEEALASQSAALDDAAERAEARARTIAESLRVEREALQELVSAIEADGGRAMNLVSMRPGDMEKTQRTLDALKSQSDAIERTVEAAGLRLNSIAAEIQQALRKAAPADARSLAEDARASVREAAHDAIGAIGDTEAATRARLFEGEAARSAAPGEESALSLADDEAAELRRRNLAELRRQMDRLRKGEEEPAATPTPPQPGQGLAARLAGAGAAAAGAALASSAAARTGEAAGSVSARVEESAGSVADAVSEAASATRASASETLSRVAQAFKEVEGDLPRTEAIAPPPAPEPVAIEPHALEPAVFEIEPPSVEPPPEPRFETAFAGLIRPPEGAGQPAAPWDMIGDFDASMVESEPLDQDAAALAAQASARGLRAPEAAVPVPPPPPEAALPAPEPVPAAPAPLFRDPTPPRAMSFDLERLAPLADMNIPSPFAATGGSSRPEPQAPSPAGPPAPAAPLFHPVGSLGEGSGEPAARGWLGASAPSEVPAGGLDSFGERREVEAAPAPATPPRPAIVWRQPESPMFGARAMPRAKPLDWEKVALGLNFPVSEEDADAEEALYEVSIDHQIGALIQASEDMLAALVDLRLYMEDHAPRIAPPEVWRSWLDGRASVDSPPVIEIGPEEALSRVRDLIDRDPAVERLAVSFAGRFEDLIRRALDESPDSGVVTRLADTRTGRAYAMVACAGGRVD
ncbi:hypothetical protein [Neomegalonema sp.]|uniref:hypothetical protein n=1 Tax=Neomegalonema sp. TaxID=2039713 RepID=UPI00263682D5|nr:hypothetical protein [Neomegalonema sp.]MDD2869120.1 hypothetical protein [Neomegalonema sp.]